MMKVKVILVKVEVNMFPVDKDGKREEFSYVDERANDGQILYLRYIRRQGK